MMQLAGFSCSLSGETLIAEPSSDYSSVDAARAAPEPALHAWEASSELNQGLRFSFEYTGSAVHAVASSQQRAVAIDDVVALSHAVQVSRVLGEFPKPNLSLPTEGGVAYELRLRWRAQREGRERLPVPAMPFRPGLSRTSTAPSRKAAARLSVKPVLSTIGKLTARKNPVHGRAYGRQKERPDRSRKQRPSGWRLSRRASSDGRLSTKRKGLPPAYHYGRSTTAIRLMATITASPKMVPIRVSGDGF